MMNNDINNAFNEVSAQARNHPTPPSSVVSTTATPQKYQASTPTTVPMPHVHPENQGVAPAVPPIEDAPNPNYMQNFEPMFMNDYIGQPFEDELDLFERYKWRKTGFANIDDNMIFIPGLYALGAITSLGKTTFAHQMADNIAALGVPVLYFSLEQSRKELVSKSIARRINQMANTTHPHFHRFTDLQIRLNAAKDRPEFVEACAAYKADVGHNLCIIQCNMTITVEEIIAIVRSYMNEFDQPPVVFIDYLQIIGVSKIPGQSFTDKQNIDHIIHELKAFQMSTDTTIISICSLNRNNYLTPVSGESFKESGGIEYTADCVLGMQLSLLEDDDFYFKEIPTGKKDAPTKLEKTTDVEKREMIKEAKSAEKREIDLVTLKIRAGNPYNVCHFLFEAKYDTFYAVDEYGKPYVSKNVPIDAVYTADSFAEWFWNNRDYGYQSYRRQMPSVGLAEEQETFAKDVPTLVLKSAMDNYIGHEQLSVYSETEIRKAITKYWEENPFSVAKMKGDSFGNKKDE